MKKKNDNVCLSCGQPLMAHSGGRWCPKAGGYDDERRYDTERVRAWIATPDAKADASPSIWVKLGRAARGLDLRLRKPSG